MAVIEEALVDILEADAAVAAVVDDRIYPIVLPQGAMLPAIVYQRISGPRAETMQGPSGLAWPRFQFVSVGATFGDAMAVAVAVRQALDGYRGMVGGVTIHGILILNEFQQFNPATAEEAESWLIYQDFRVWHLE